MKNFLPFEKVLLKTSLSEENAIKRLSQYVEIPMSVFAKSFGKSAQTPYEGRISGNKFKIARAIRSRNPGLPKIRGIVYRENASTLIKLSLKLHGFIMVFFFGWIIGSTIGVISVSVNMAKEGVFNPIVFVPLGILLAGYLIFMIGFWIESKIAKRDLMEYFEAEQVIG